MPQEPRYIVTSDDEDEDLDMVTEKLSAIYSAADRIRRIDNREVIGGEGISFTIWECVPVMRVSGHNDLKVEEDDLS